MDQILGDQVVQSEVLEGLALARNHRRWFAGLALPYLGDDAIEIGSGLGDYAVEWTNHVPRMTLTEADPDRLVALKERFADDPAVTVSELLLPTDLHGSHSAAVSYNVLEHIEDDIEALRSIRQLLRPGGAVILVVPAFEFAMSDVDRVVGHVRRYTKRTMTHTLTKSGFDVERVEYVNALGLIGYYMATSVFKLVPREGPMVKFYDRYVVPATRQAERLVQPPFGQSVFAVGRMR